MGEVTLLGNQLLCFDEEGKNLQIPLSESHRVLWCTVQIHESATVRTLMEILSADPVFYSKALMEPYLLDLVKAYRNPTFSSKKGHIDTVGFGWRSDYWKYKEDYSRFNFKLDIFGKNKEESNWAIEFRPLYELIDLPIFLDESFTVYVYDVRPEKEKKKKTTLHDKEYDFGNLEIYLIDVLKAFVFEVTFCGNEEDKIEQWEELSERLEDAKEAIESGNFREYSSVDEMKDELFGPQKEIQELDENIFRKMMGEEDEKDEEDEED